jgi:outer membrane protein assembly factor BamA
MRRLAGSSAFIFIFILLLVSIGRAQKQPAKGNQAGINSPEKLSALTVTGTTRYTNKEILAASGLHIGQPASDGDFKEAVQLLGDSGLFSQLSYSYTSNGSSVKLELQVADTDQRKLVPAHFENFAWFTDQELLDALKARVPLFKQLLPLTGNFPDRLSEALQSILTERRLPGRVNYIREGDESGGALHAIVYRVEEVSILLRNVDFPGASPEQTTLLANVAKRLTGAQYSRTSLAAAAKFDFLPVYLQRGYLKAAFGPSDARVVSSPSPTADSQEAAEFEVDAIVPVTPGKVYLTSIVDWKGNSALPTTQLAPLIHLPLAEPADAVRLQRDLESVVKLYRSRGYMMVKASSEAKFDDDKTSVHYDLNIVEGDLYRMGELEILGLDTQSAARLRAAWALHEGQPYNADYPRNFHEETGSLLPRGVGWNVSTHETLNAKDKTVDVEIRFKQQ